MRKYLLSSLCIVWTHVGHLCIKFSSGVLSYVVPYDKMTIKKKLK